MKKTSAFKSIVAAFAASTLFACTQDVADNLTVQTESDANVTKELPKYRTYEEALAVAQDAIGLLGESSTTRSGKPRTVNTSDVQYILNSSSTRSDGEPDTLMYVFNYEDNAGFAVVSANRATEELIAVTEQGNYVAGEETGNGGFDLYMDLAESYVSGKIQPTSTGPAELTQIKTVEYRDTTWYGPYLTVEWGQGDPYNLYSYTEDGYHAWAGCMATAVAQIISFYEEPKQMQITYDGSNSNLSLNWSSIKQHASDDNCNYCGQHTTIGKMFRQIGEELHLVYVVQPYGESTHVKSTFEKFGYSIGDKTAYSLNKVMGSLSDGNLVLMLGLEKNSEEEGHAWVLDGYRRIKVTQMEYTRPNDAAPWQLLSNNIYYLTVTHINWGWDGEANGYFSANVFNPIKKGTKYEYTHELEIFPDIYY